MDVRIVVHPRGEACAPDQRDGIRTLPTSAVHSTGERQRTPW